MRFFLYEKQKFPDMARPGRPVGVTQAACAWSLLVAGFRGSSLPGRWSLPLADGLARIWRAGNYLETKISFCFRDCDERSGFTRAAAKVSSDNTSATHSQVSHSCAPMFAVEMCRCMR